MKSKFLLKQKIRLIINFLSDTKLTAMVLAVSILFFNPLVCCQQTFTQKSASLNGVPGFSQWAMTLEQYEPLIERYGEKMVGFLLCMGLKWAQKCVVPSMACAAVANPLSCITLIVCEGVNTVLCASKHFFNRTLDG